MKVLVTGASGQLGSDVVNELNKRGHISHGVSSKDLDITDCTMVDQVICSENFDAIIHCAAYTLVDAAEDNVEQCHEINAVGTENIARTCKKLDIKMMYISTDYVFDGEGTIPWKPDDLNRNPLNVYGQTKYEGELAVENYIDRYFIVRIAWVFGVNGNNFVKTMLKLGEIKKEVSVVCDQHGSPTYTHDLARLLVDMLETDKYGRYHATNEGECTWYEFAKEIFFKAGMDVKVNPITSKMFPAKAKRPHNSLMDKSKLVEKGFKLLPTWQDALKRYLEVIR